MHSADDEYHVEEGLEWSGIYEKQIWDIQQKLQTLQSQNVDRNSPNVLTRVPELSRSLITQ